MYLMYFSVCMNAFFELLCLELGLGLGLEFKFHNEYYIIELIELIISLIF